MRFFPSSSNLLLIINCYSSKCKSRTTQLTNYLLEEDEIVIETPTFSRRETADILSPVPLHYREPDTYRQKKKDIPSRPHLLRQVLRFGMVGGLNTLVDLLILNGLLWFLPTTSTRLLLAYNAIAYGLGAINSFFLNKYWTFGSRQKTSHAELLRFSLTIMCGMAWSSAILWLAGTLLHPFVGNTTLWANTSKGVAIIGTVFISYLGMHLWVFVSKAPKENLHIQQPLISRKHPF